MRAFRLAGDNLLLTLSNQSPDRLGGLGSTLDPVADALKIELQFDWLTTRIVESDDLNKPSIALATLLGNHHAVKRLLLGTLSRQSDS